MSLKRVRQVSSCSNLNFHVLIELGFCNSQYFYCILSQKVTFPQSYSFTRISLLFCKDISCMKNTVVSPQQQKLGCSDPTAVVNLFLSNLWFDYVHANKKFWQIYSPVMKQRLKDYAKNRTRIFKQQIRQVNLINMECKYLSII